jgi:hypothetical protein
MPLTRIDIERGTSSRVSTHGTAVSAVAIDHTTDGCNRQLDGTIGPVSGDDPHVLLSKGGGGRSSPSFSRDGRWIAASGEVRHGLASLTCRRVLSTAGRSTRC